jgi:amino acid transporter
MASLAALIPYLYSTFAALVLLKRPPHGFTTCDKLLVPIASIAAIYAFWVISIAGEKIIFYGSILVFTSALLYGWGYGNAPKEVDIPPEEEQI